MKFSEFWHVLTTSRYTRHLEQENRELRDEVRRLRVLVAPQMREPVTAQQIVQRKEQKPLPPSHIGWQSTRARLEAEGESNAN